MSSVIGISEWYTLCLYLLDIAPATERRLLSLAQRHHKLILKAATAGLLLSDAPRSAKKSKLSGPSATPLSPTCTKRQKYAR